MPTLLWIFSRGLLLPVSLSKALHWDAPKATSFSAALASPLTTTRWIPLEGDAFWTYRVTFSLLLVVRLALKGLDGFWTTG